MSQKKKDYIVTYRSQEHYEVLGWVRASSLEEAREKAKKELLDEAKHYRVEEAKIAEWKGGDNIYFEIF